jgi:D-xylose transport system substrate-binding protein
MYRKFLTLAAGALVLGAASMSSAEAAGKNICVSWKTFQEERWKTDEAAIKAVVEAAGNKYASADAQGSAAKQQADIEGLITQRVQRHSRRRLRFRRDPAGLPGRCRRRREDDFL